ncbi:hypothetical protein ACROYT_G023517 [Oculina patagonica]
MPLRESYVIWNNKGGVGKTTLTFHMATHYARSNPGVRVLVIDLCPQANVSMALLSSPNQQGSERLTELYNDRITVSFYLHKANAIGPVVNADDYLTTVNDYNNQVPTNLSLLCGDTNLELVGRHLEQIRSLMAVFGDNPWMNVTTSIQSFIEGSEGRITGVTENQDGQEWVVFIDTNPSFSVYTEIALAAAKKLIIPMNADDFSKEAVRAMLNSVYGITPEEQEEQQHDFEAYRAYSFSYKAQQNHLRLPQIHLLVNNRTTKIFTRSATAFHVMGEENLKVLFEAYQQHQGERECFAQRDGEIDNYEAFKEQYFKDLQDFHTTAILSLHSGCPLEVLSGKVSLSEEEAVKADQRKVNEYLNCLDNLVQML